MKTMTWMEKTVIALAGLNIVLYILSAIRLHRWSDISSAGAWVCVIGWVLIAARWRAIVQEQRELMDDMLGFQAHLMEELNRRNEGEEWKG